MSAVTDEAVLAVLKRYPQFRDVIASVSTLHDAKSLASPHKGMRAALGEQAQFVRRHLEQEAADTEAATIVGQDPNLH